MLQQYDPENTFPILWLGERMKETSCNPSNATLVDRVDDENREGFLLPRTRGSYNIKRIMIFRRLAVQPFSFPKPEAEVAVIVTVTEHGLGCVVAPGKPGERATTTYLGSNV